MLGDRPQEEKMRMKKFSIDDGTSSVAVTREGKKLSFPEREKMISPAFAAYLRRWNGRNPFVQQDMLDELAFAESQLVEKIEITAAGLPLRMAYEADVWVENELAGSLSCWTYGDAVDSDGIVFHGENDAVTEWLSTDSDAADWLILASQNPKAVIVLEMDSAGTEVITPHLAAKIRQGR